MHLAVASLQPRALKVLFAFSQLSTQNVKLLCLSRELCAKRKIAVRGRRSNYKQIRKGAFAVVNGLPCCTHSAQGLVLPGSGVSGELKKFRDLRIDIIHGMHPDSCCERSSNDGWSHQETCIARSLVSLITLLECPFSLVCSDGLEQSRSSKLNGQLRRIAHAQTGKISNEPKWNPNVQVILSQERYYGDGPPKWREGKNKRPCQTSAQAKIERRKAVKRLRRAGKENAAALNLASRIAACAPKQRCGSGACPECARAWQRWFVIATRNFLKSEPRKSVTVLNPIYVSGKIEPGSLCDPDVLENAQGSD